MIGYYDRKGRPLSSSAEWIPLMNKNYQRVALDEIDGITVSTVWLGLDHSFGEGPPIIFESMIFGNHPQHEWQWRYATEEEAREGHRKIVEAIQNGTEIPEDLGR